MTEYPSNSRAQNPQPPSREGLEVKKVTTGKVTVRPRPFSKKLAETFTNDDVQSVGSYIFNDVFIPAVKSFIHTSLSDGSARLLWGSTSAPRRSGDNPSYTSYNRFSGGGQRPRVTYSPASRSSRPEPSRKPEVGDKNVRHTSECLMESRAEAEAVIDDLNNIIETYSVATVQDFYTMVGVTSLTEYTDNSWGWSEPITTPVKSVRGGYLIDLPPARPIED